MTTACPFQIPSDLESLWSFATPYEREQLIHLASPRMPAGACPHNPHPRQREFLWLSDVPEVLYGGAAGGGKTDALLMAALQYIDVPNYAAVIFRRTYPQLSAADSPIARSKEWLGGTSARWKESEHRWTWPNGATLSFAHMENEGSWDGYRGPAFQFVGYDELTQFTEKQYTYLFSRMRRIEGSQVPTRMRSASNPGGVGHLWVKKRFIDREDGKPLSHRRFVPAKLADNPSLDQADYIKNLDELDPVTRKQLLEGDWTVGEKGRIDPTWLRYYGWHGEHYKLNDGSNRVVDPRSCLRFITVDPAGTSMDVEAERKGKNPSWTVISVWDHAGGALIWRDLVRIRKEIPDVIQAIVNVAAAHRPAWVGVEFAGIGIAVCQELPRRGLQIRELKPDGKDKLTRAATALNMLERGEVYLPEAASWRRELEDEMATWTGHKDDQADQIDTLSYAAMEMVQGSYQPATIAPMYSSWLR